MAGETGLLARLLYGTGMRLMEGMRLRVKDVEFDRHGFWGQSPNSLSPQLARRVRCMHRNEIGVRPQ